jgi:hypothetical protein
VRISTRWTVLPLLFLSFAPLHAEVIQLKNGNKITGKLTGVNGDTFIVNTDYGEIQVPRSDVVSISFPENDPKKTDAAAQTPPIDESLVETIYINRTESFQATVPKGWKIYPEMRQETKGVVAALISEDQTLFLLVTAEPFSGTLTTYEVLAESQFKSTFTNYEKLDESQSTLDGRNGIRLVFHGESRAKPGATLKFLIYILPYEGRMVRLTLFTLDPLFDNALPIFEKIAKSYSTLPHQ